MIRKEWLKENKYCKYKFFLDRGQNSFKSNPYCTELWGIPPRRCSFKRCPKL